MTEVKPAPCDDERWDIVAERILRHGNAPDALIEVLHAVQEVYGYLDPAALHSVSDALGVSLSKVFAVATFYSFFTLSPPGAHTCVVCTGTACYIDGSTAILDGIADSLGVRPGETTDDGRVSLLAVRCYGTCSLAPLVVLDGEVRGRVRVEDVVRGLEEL